METPISDIGNRYLYELGRRHVRPMRQEDVETVVDIHIAGFPGFFLTSLGRKFLLLYYSEVIRSQLGIAFVYTREGRILGFAAGYFNPGKFYLRLFLRRAFAFAFYSLRAVANQPLIIPRIIRSVLMRFGAPKNENVAELASLAVLPNEEGRGYGLAIIAACIEHIKRKGGKSIVLDVLKENQSLIQAYQRMGFKVEGEVAKPNSEILVKFRYQIGDREGGG